MLPTPVAGNSMAGHIHNLISSNTTTGAGAGTPNANVVLVAIFDFIHILAFTLLCLVLLTAALAPSVHRSPTWFNFLATWVLYCISYLAILGQQVGEEPHFSVCLLQAMFIYAAPAVTVTAGLCFTIEMWRIVKGVGSLTGRLGSGLLIFAPYIVQLSICIEVLILGLKHREHVVRNQTNMFCHLEDPNSFLSSYVTAAVVICAIIVVMVFLVSTGLHIRRGMAASRIFQPTQVANVQRMVIRFGIFSALPVAGLILSIAQFAVNPSSVTNGILTISAGAPPIGAALIFGTQSDLIRAWNFCGRRSRLKNPPRGHSGAKPPPENV